MSGEREIKVASNGFDVTDSRIRHLTFTIATMIGVTATLYFGIVDGIRGNRFGASVSFAVAAVLSLVFVANMVVMRLRRAINVVFVALVGAVFLALLHTQFPERTVTFWGFVFPLVAVAVAERRQAFVGLVLYNVGVAFILALNVRFQNRGFSHDYAVRYISVTFVISVLAYYYEVLRFRSARILRGLNSSLEERIEESRRKLEDAQDRLRQSEKLEAIGQLAGGIAHDFNNQLTGITAYAEMIRAEAGEDEEVRECAEGILTASRRSAEMIRQLLAFARKGNLLSVPVDMNKVTSDVAALLERAIDKRVSVHVELTDESSTVVGDPGQLENVLLNIALNGSDAMPEGGELTLATAGVDLDEMQCRHFPYPVTPGRHVRLTVSDTGCGMTRDTMNRIFEPFFTTKASGKGTGMGLAAVYGTVRSLNGAVTVDSTPAGGTTFTVYLPQGAAQARPSAAEPEASHGGKHTGHILLVDDEESVCRSVEKLLQSLGFSVTAVDNGKDAVEYYRENRQAVTLVILDMVMPSMGGKEVFLAMKEIDPEVRVLLASGYSLEGEAQSILDLGVKGFIQKPFTPVQLSEKMDSAIGD